jgi:ABC-type amino acid transport substrate-binding protein
MEQCGIGTRKGDALLSKVNKSLASLKKDGTTTSVFQQPEKLLTETKK